MFASSLRRTRATAAVCRWIHWLAIGTALATSTGCAQLSPDQAEGSTQSAALAKQQDDRAAVAAGASGRRVWLAGYAMSSTSTAFQGDMELVSRRLSELGGPVLTYEHSNGPQTNHLRYPFATPLTARETIRRRSRRA